MEQERYHGRIDRGIRLGIPGGLFCKEKIYGFSRFFFNMKDFVFVSEFANLKDGNIWRNIIATKRIANSEVDT